MLTLLKEKKSTNKTLPRIKRVLQSSPFKFQRKKDISRVPKIESMATSLKDKS